MKIDLNRLSQLAGIKNTGSNLNESVAYEGSAIDGLEEEVYEGSAVEDMEEGTYEGSAIDGLEEVVDEKAHDELDEVIEIDEVMLVQELRRAKSLMESRKKKELLESKKKEARKEALYEAQLRKAIDAEVKAVLAELQDGQWVYGDDKPTRSKKGYTHQGSFLKGMGFK
jgi:hypothetical protein